MQAYTYTTASYKCARAHLWPTAPKSTQDTQADAYAQRTVRTSNSCVKCCRSPYCEQLVYIFLRWTQLLARPPAGCAGTSGLHDSCVALGRLNPPLKRAPALLLQNRLLLRGVLLVLSLLQQVCAVLLPLLHAEPANSSFSSELLRNLGYGVFAFAGFRCWAAGARLLLSATVCVHCLNGWRVVLAGGATQSSL